MKLKALGVMVLALAGLTACDRIDPDSPLGKRKAIFQEMLDVKEDLGGMLRGRLAFDAAAFSERAVYLDELSRQPWQYYPPVKEAESDARDDVWQRQERFKELARALEARTAELVQATTGQPPTPQRVAEPFQRVEDACEACHQEFRVY